MSKLNTHTTLGESTKNNNNSLKTELVFGKHNYKFMFIGLACIVLGFILMSGGGSDDPNVYSDAIFNWRRIRLAPALIIIGFGIQVYAILSNPKKD